MLWVLISAVLFCTGAQAQKRVLYVMHSAGYHHDSTLAASRAFQQIAERTGKLEFTTTTDVSTLNAANLQHYDAVFFFTSGELPITDTQKRDLLNFIRSGKGFGGAHSATDTLYGWPEYGDLIGGYFDGHPWVKEVGIDVEDSAFPGIGKLAPSFLMVDEIYQHRDFSRDRVRVLMTLDTSTVDLAAPGVNRTDGDFALAWIRQYGEGRVFYTALGHLDETWQDERFQKLLEGALLWMTAQEQADAIPRSGRDALEPVIAPDGIGSVVGPADGFAPGSVIAIRGERLTNGSTFTVTTNTPPRKLVGSRVELNGVALPLVHASPGELHVLLPSDLTPGTSLDIRVWVVGLASLPAPLRIVESAPVLISGERKAGSLLLRATGFGVAPGAPAVSVNGVRMEVISSTVSATQAGIQEIVVQLPQNINGPLEVQMELGSFSSNRLTIPTDS